MFKQVDAIEKGTSKDAMYTNSRAGERKSRSSLVRPCEGGPRSSNGEELSIVAPLMATLVDTGITMMSKA